MEEKEPVAVQKKPSAIREIVQFLLIALVVVVPIRIFVAQPFIVNGSSMSPTFEHGQYLIVDELTYRFDDPKRSDVVIFRYPENPSQYFIKRIIGLPKETVEVYKDKVKISNSDFPNGVTLNEPYAKYDGWNDFKTTLGESEYFVMGDNRPQSSDSRKWGPLERNLIVGKPLIRLFPLKAIEIKPGSIK